MRKSILSFLNKFKDDDSATLTVEFILILPVLMTWFIGSIVFFDAFNSKATAQRTAHTIADIVSRQTSVDNSFVAELLVLQNRMMPRVSVGTVRVSSIGRDLAGDLQMLWTRSTNIASTPLTMADVPLSQIPTVANGESIIMIDTSVPFVPISDWIGFTAANWENHVAISPRFVEPLPNTDFP